LLETDVLLIWTAFSKPARHRRVKNLFQQIFGAAHNSQPEFNFDAVYSGTLLFAIWDLLIVTPECYDSEREAYYCGSHRFRLGRSKTEVEQKRR